MGDSSADRIRTEQPINNTLHNLIQTLSVKLDSLARYGLYQEDAEKDGYADCAELFARLASRDDAAIRELIRSLQTHLGSVGSPPARDMVDLASEESMHASDPPAHSIPS